MKTMTKLAAIAIILGVVAGCDNPPAQHVIVQQPVAPVNPCQQDPSQCQQQVQQPQVVVVQQPVAVVHHDHSGFLAGVVAGHIMSRPVYSAPIVRQRVITRRIITRPVMSHSYSRSFGHR